ncbi:hypothetical protein B0H11DRAFT_2230071 [Mycena galericulata]|nr:hypothetical protein B0H11DRAFT_2230071 [Mycena galericulata]
MTPRFSPPPLSPRSPVIRSSPPIHTLPTLYPCLVLPPNLPSSSLPRRVSLSPSRTFSADHLHTLPRHASAVNPSPRTRHIFPEFFRPTPPSSSPLLPPVLYSLSLPSPYPLAPYPRRSPPRRSPALATRSLLSSSLSRSPLPAPSSPLASFFFSGHTTYPDPACTDSIPDADIDDRQPRRQHDLTRHPQYVLFSLPPASPFVRAHSPFFRQARTSTASRRPGTATSRTRRLRATCQLTGGRMGTSPPWGSTLPPATSAFEAFASPAGRSGNRAGVATAAAIRAVRAAAALSAFDPAAKAREDALAAQRVAAAARADAKHAEQQVDPYPRLRTAVLPQATLPRFLAIASANTTRDLETLFRILPLIFIAFCSSRFPPTLPPTISGKMCYVVDTLLIPKQYATSGTYTMDEAWIHGGARRSRWNGPRFDIFDSCASTRPSRAGGSSEMPSWTSSPSSPSTLLRRMSLLNDLVRDANTGAS